MDILVSKCFIVVLTGVPADGDKYVTVNGNRQSSAFSAFTQSRDTADLIMRFAKEKFGDLDPVLMQGSINLDVEPVVETDAS